jgi:hypothetical protein
MLAEDLVNPKAPDSRVHVSQRAALHTVVTEDWRSPPGHTDCLQPVVDNPRPLLPGSGKGILPALMTFPSHAGQQLLHLGTPPNGRVRDGGAKCGDGGHGVEHYPMTGEGLQQLNNLPGPGAKARAKQRPGGDVQLVQQQKAATAST